jgi:Lon protease-like protein
MVSDWLLPLFPLEVVLLPQATLPLHIFESRYKLMIGEALEQQSEFGVVLFKQNSLVNVGCTAAIERVVRKYPDGRLDIITAGRRRFEILFLNQEKPYLQAGVHFFADDAGTAPTEAASSRLQELFQRIQAFLPPGARLPGSPGRGRDSFQIAGALPLDLDFKQRLLALRSEAERVALLSEYLEKLAPRLQLTKRVERSAQGNGHGR